MLFCGSNQLTIHDDVLFLVTTLDGTTNTLLIGNSINTAERSSAKRVRRFSLHMQNPTHDRKHQDDKRRRQTSANADDNRSKKGKDGNCKDKAKKTVKRQRESESCTDEPKHHSWLLHIDINISRSQNICKSVSIYLSRNVNSYIHI